MKKTDFDHSPTSGSVLLQCFFTPLRVLLVMKTHKDEWYTVIKALKFIVFEFLKDSSVLS